MQNNRQSLDLRIKLFNRNHNFPWHSLIQQTFINVHLLWSHNARHHEYSVENRHSPFSHEAQQNWGKRHYTIRVNKYLATNDENLRKNNVRSLQSDPNWRYLVASPHQFLRFSSNIDYCLCQQSIPTFWMLSLLKQISKISWYGLNSALQTVPPAHGTEEYLTSAHPKDSKDL